MSDADARARAAMIHTMGSDAPPPVGLRMGDWFRARIRSSRAPYQPSVHQALAVLHATPVDLTMPWETGSLSSVLGARGFLPPPLIPLVQDPRAVRPRECETAQQIRAVKEPWKASVVHSRAWADVEDDRRTSALEMWKLIVLTSGKGTKVGRDLARMQNEGAPAASIDQCLRDVFSAKSVSTLKARAASLAHFARWRASVGLDAAVFPLEEAEVYRYLCFLRSEGAPRSRAPRLREAINFAGAMLGSDVSETANSSRVQGAANPQLQAIAVRKKIPLTVAQVRGLEEFVLNSDNDLAAVLAGFALYCLHGRLRWSDAQHTESEPVLDLCDGKDS